MGDAPAAAGAAAAAPSELLAPFEYITRNPGKQIRPKLLDAFNAWLQVPADKLNVIKDVIQQLHNASLLIDDIEDNSVTRRGAPAAHVVYGTPLTINCANYVYFLALQDVQRLEDPRGVAVFGEEVLHLHRGQGYDLYWREKQVCPTLDEYRRMVLDKTGGLFRMAIRLMQLFSTNQTPMNGLVDDLSLFFQIRDDYLNLASEEYMKTKIFCEDITEGKYSFPIICHLRKTSPDDEVAYILKQRTESDALKRHAVDCIAKSGSFEETRSELLKLKDDVLSGIEKIGPNPALLKIVQFLCVAFEEA